MVSRLFLASAALFVATSLACSEQSATAPLLPPDGPAFVGPSCGGFHPTSGTVYVDSVATFSRDTISINCADRYGELDPASGDAGFSNGPGCTLTATVQKLHFKVRGCAVSSVYLRIYEDSTKANLLQTIPISVEVP